MASDLERIEAAVADPSSWRADPAQLTSRLSESSEANLQERWKQRLQDMARFSLTRVGVPPGRESGLAQLERDLRAVPYFQPAPSRSVA